MVELGNTTALGNITANSTGITTFNQTVNAASLKQMLRAKLNSMAMSRQLVLKLIPMQ
jgi:hypothetical protein